MFFLENEISDILHFRFCINIISFLSQSSTKNITVQLIIASRLTSSNSQYLLSNPKMSEIGHFYKEEIFFLEIFSIKNVTV